MLEQKLEAANPFPGPPLWNGAFINHADVWDQINCENPGNIGRKSAAICSTKIDLGRERGYLPPPAPKFVIRRQTRPKPRACTCEIKWPARVATTPSPP